MPQEYTVTSSEEHNRWQSSHGKNMVTYTLGLEEFEGPVRTNRLDTSAAPLVGDKIYGDLEDDGEHPKKLVKKQDPNKKGGGRQGGGGKPGGGYSPSDIGAMRRANAQEKALKFMEIRGLVPFIDTESGEVEIRPPENAVELKVLIGWFEADVAAAAERAASAASS